MRQLKINMGSYTEVSLYIYFIYIMLPCCSVVLPSGVRTLVILYLVFSMIVGTTLVYRSKMVQMSILHILMCLAVVFCFYGKRIYTFSDLIGYFTNSYMFWGAIAYSYIMESWSEERKKRGLKVLLLTIVVTMITTFVGNIQHPEASRLLSDVSRDYADLYLKMNIGTYGFIYGLAIALPYFFYKSKDNKKYILLIILSFGVLFVAQYSLALIISIIISILCVFVSDGKKSKKIIIAFGMVGIGIFFKPIMKGLMTLMQYFIARNNLSMMSNRFDSISALLVEGQLTGGALVRWELYAESWKAFIRRPLLGNLLKLDKYELGGHSEVLDVLGAGGIVLFLICLLVMVPYFRNIAKNKKTELNVYQKYSFLAFLLVAIVNPVFVSGNISIVTFIFPKLLKRECSGKDSISKLNERK